MATDNTIGTTRSFSNTLSPLARNGAAVLGLNLNSGKKSKTSDTAVSKVSTQTLQNANTPSPQKRTTLTVPSSSQVGIARSPSPKKETPPSSPDSESSNRPPKSPVATLSNMQSRLRKDSSSSASPPALDLSPKNASPIQKPIEVQPTETSDLAKRRKILRPRGRHTTEEQMQGELAAETLRQSFQSLRITTEMYNSIDVSKLSASPLSPSRQQGLGLKKTQTD